MRIIIFIMLCSLISYLSATGINQQKIREYRDIALKNNLEIQMERKKLEASQAKVYQASSNFLPNINFNARVTNFDKEVSIPLSDSFSLTLQPKKNTSAKIEGTQVLFSPAVFYNFLMQKSLTKSDNYAFQSKISDLEYKVLEAYYNCMKAHELVKMRQTSLKLAQETHFTTQKLFQVDKVPETDVLRANVLLISSEQEVEEAINQLNLATNYFNSLLNQEISATVVMDSLNAGFLMEINAKTEFKNDEPIEDLVKMALETRPEIRQMFLGYRSIKYARAIMVSDNLPSIVLAGDYGYSGKDFSYNEDEKSWSVSGLFSWNLFSGFNSTAKSVEVNAQVKQMEKLYHNTRHLIELEVRNNHQQLKNAIKQFEVAQKTYKASSVNYQMVLKQYENDLAPMITLTDAKNLLDSANTNLIVNYFNVLLARANLDKCLGKSVIN